MRLMVFEGAEDDVINILAYHLMRRTPGEFTSQPEVHDGPVAAQPF